MAGELKATYANLEQKVEQRTYELSALYSVTATVSQSLDLDLILKEAIGKVLEALGFEAGRIFLLDREGRRLAMRVAVGLPEEYLPSLPYALGEGIIGRVAATGEPFVLEDMQTDPEFRGLVRGKQALESGFHANVTLPIRAREKILGVLNLLSYRPYSFQPEQIQFFTSMVSQIGVALENGRLFEEVKEKSSVLEGLLKVNRDMAAILDRGNLLSRIAEQARNLLRVDSVSFRMIEGEATVRIAYAGEPAHTFMEKAARGESLSDRVLLADRPLIIEKLLEDTGIPEQVLEAFRRAGYQSFLGVPLRMHDRVIGTVNFYSKGKRSFSPDDVEIVRAFGDQAAVAITNATLFAELKKKTDELERLNQDLEEASRAKSQFMSAMSHELRTPLGVIIGLAQLVRDESFGGVNEKQKEVLGKILRHSDVLLKMVNDVLVLNRVEARKMTLDLSTFDVHEVLSHLEAYVEHLNRDRQIEVLWKVPEDLPEIKTDPWKLEEILQNLIGNAFKFTPKGRIEISIVSLEDENRLAFTVADTGVGIAPEEIDRIFEEFRQLGEAHTGRFSGAGLGLAIVKRYLDLMKGDIRVESDPGKGSKFTFTLPTSI
jgi:signal transduction histidine kinase